MTNRQTYPTQLVHMIRDLAAEGYAPRDIRQAAEFLRGTELHDITAVTLTFRDKVATMLCENGAPREPHRVLSCGCYADSPMGHVCASGGSWELWR